MVKQIHMTWFDFHNSSESINFQICFKFSYQGEMIHVAKFVKIMREKTGLVVMLAVNISMPAASM